MSWDKEAYYVFLSGLAAGVSLSVLCQYGGWFATSLQKKGIQKIGKHSHSTSRSSFDDCLVPLNKAFLLSNETLHDIVRGLLTEMKKGLEVDGANLKMIPTFVVKRPTGLEKGSYLALDFGGSNFRVCEAQLEGHGRVRNRQSKFAIPDDLKVASGEKLFAFFAQCIKKFLQEVSADLSKLRHLGFTFSFPINQTSISAGTLMVWNKGFTCDGVVNQDVVALLHNALLKEGLNVHVSALVNDTVGTLISHAYSDPQTFVGVIIGTGTNAAYIERIQDVPKFRDLNLSAEEMVINTEWGAYNDTSVLPLTEFDLALDKATNNPGLQIYEKMISGMYLGEIVRLALLKLVGDKDLFHGKDSLRFRTPYAFETSFMSRIERDHSATLNDTKAVLENLLAIATTTLRDRMIVKRVCELVGLRAARLSAAGVAAIVSKMNRFDNCSIAIDGSVFEHYPHFSNRMRDALRDILGITAENIDLQQARDGSGQGAALIAALSAE